jgi:hypothetical protein
LLRNWLLIHTRRVHGRIRLRTQARARLGIRNINNVPFNGTIDFDLLIKRLDGDGSWSEDHLILGEKFMGPVLLELASLEEAVEE